MPGGEGDDKPAEETNFYKITLKNCRDTLIPRAMDVVYDGTGDPGKPIADAINAGGWECTQADTWVAEMLQHTGKVMPAFQEAQSTVGTAARAEPDTVPKDDPHGLAWNRTWHIRQRNL